jgi:hypothetical protein
MSQAFSIVCRETRQRVRIGQGWGSMTTLHFGAPRTMQRLTDFLNATRGKPLEFVCNDLEDDVLAFEEFGEPLPPDTMDTRRP